LAHFLHMFCDDPKACHRKNEISPWHTFCR
jgi:hypothetical protein